MRENAVEHPASPPAPAAGRADRARQVLVDILRLMGVEAQVDARQDKDTVALSIEPGAGADAVGLRAGERGPVLDALTVVANRAINRAGEGRAFVSVDIGGFRPEEDPEMIAMARRLAAKAGRIGKPLAVGPMSPRDRRQVHLALTSVPEVQTRSEGEGVSRRLLVIPARPDEPERGPAA